MLCYSTYSLTLVPTLLSPPAPWLSWIPLSLLSPGRQKLEDKAGFFGNRAYSSSECETTSHTYYMIVLVGKGRQKESPGM